MYKTRGRSSAGRAVSLLATLAVGLTWLACGDLRAEEPILPIPENVDVDPAKVELGRKLFHDPILSKDGTISCASCHDLAGGGDDGRKISLGVDDKPGMVNSPTVFNAGMNFKQFWDGRASTLEHQIDGPVQTAFEMGSLWPDVVAKLYRDGAYPKLFKKSYPDGINRKNADSGALDGGSGDI